MGFGYCMHKQSAQDEEQCVVCECEKEIFCQLMSGADIIELRFYTLNVSLSSLSHTHLK